MGFNFSKIFESTSIQHTCICGKQLLLDEKDCGNNLCIEEMKMWEESEKQNYEEFIKTEYGQN